MKLLQWCKANAMPVIAVLAAAVTAVFVPPDADYLGYYDVKTLSCLLCVLAVVGALRGIGLFLSPCWRRSWCRCSTPPGAR